MDGYVKFRCKTSSLVFLRKKIKMSFTGLGRSVLEKTVPSACLEYVSRQQDSMPSGTAFPGADPLAGE